jgi:DNA-directed RNA polymerase specialized sigma24 family protein
MDNRPALSPLAFYTIRSSLIRNLSGAFPGMCSGLIEDAVDEAWLAFLAHQERCRRRAGLDPVDEILVPWSWMRRVAWRQLRGACRRRSYQLELGVERLEDLDLPEDGTQEERLGMEQVVATLVPEAARRFGHGRKDELELALTARLVDGLSDLEAAETYGVPREYVNKAKLWFVSQVVNAREAGRLTPAALTPAA